MVGRCHSCPSSAHSQAVPHFDVPAAHARPAPLNAKEAKIRQGEEHHKQLDVHVPRSNHIDKRHPEG